MEDFDKNAKQGLIFFFSPITFELENLDHLGSSVLKWSEKNSTKGIAIYRIGE